MGYFYTIEERFMLINLIHLKAKAYFKDFKKAGASLFELTVVITEEKNAYQLTKNDPIYQFLKESFKGHYKIISTYIQLDNDFDDFYGDYFEAKKEV